MFNTISKIAVAGAVIAMFASFAPNASAQTWSGNRIRNRSYNVQQNNWSRWNNWRDRDGYHNRHSNWWRYGHTNFNYLNRFPHYFRNNLVYLGSPYYRYVPYVYYERYLPSFSTASTVVIVNFDDPSNAVVIGNPTGYNRIVILRVDAGTFWRIKNALDINDLSDFDWNDDVLRYRTSLGDQSVNDVMGDVGD